MDDDNMKRLKKAAEFLGKLRRKAYAMLITTLATAVASSVFALQCRRHFAYFASEKYSGFSATLRKHELMESAGILAFATAIFGASVAIIVSSGALLWFLRKVEGILHKDHQN